MTEVVEYKVADGVAEVRLNRPARLNAVTPELVEQLCRALEQGIRANVSALVLSGNGGSFCSGYDLRQPPRRQSLAQRRQDLQRIQDVTRLIRRSPHPVIAAVQGYALGAGCEFALACDLVLMTRDAVLGFPEVEVGLSITGGVTHMLPRLIGSTRAKYFALLGERIPAETALQLGLAIKLVEARELMPTAREYARRLAALPQASLRITKRTLDRAPLVTLDEALELEIDDAIALTGIDQGWTGADAFRSRKSKAADAYEKETPMPDRQTSDVCLITEGDIQYSALSGADNMELNRALTAAASTSLGGGFIRFPEPGQLKDWTLRYDEFVFVLQGEMSIRSGATNLSIQAGQGCLIRKGTTVTYQGAKNTKAIYVLHPIDWEIRGLRWSPLFEA